jgi:hypothetical protein
MAKGSRERSRGNQGPRLIELRFRWCVEGEVGNQPLPRWAQRFPRLENVVQAIQ